MKTIFAGDANRHFSKLLRDVASGEVITVLSCGKHVATIAPAGASDSERKAAKLNVEVADSAWFAFQAALDLTVDHQLQIWDALILAVAAENHCRLLLSEDFQGGCTWRGVTVVNPFATQPSPRLSGLFR